MANPEHRFGIEHSLRLMKGELILDAAQFNGPAAQQRIALWVELVANRINDPERWTASSA